LLYDLMRKYRRNQRQGSVIPRGFHQGLSVLSGFLVPK
jgi:hypothetical protein